MNDGALYPNGAPRLLPGTSAQAERRILREILGLQDAEVLIELARWNRAPHILGNAYFSVTYDQLAEGVAIKTRSARESIVRLRKRLLVDMRRTRDRGGRHRNLYWVNTPYLWARYTAARANGHGARIELHLTRYTLPGSGKDLARIWHSTRG